ncbi:MAG: hypothetical protein LBB68_07770, partial [Treponema sp.]|nr:hypothetical protein [Treponema sp.]
NRGYGEDRHSQGLYSPGLVTRRWSHAPLAGFAEAHKRFRGDHVFFPCQDPIPHSRAFPET